MYKCIYIYLFICPIRICVYIYMRFFFMYNDRYVKPNKVDNARLFKLMYKASFCRIKILHYIST